MIDIDYKMGIVKIKCTMAELNEVIAMKEEIRR